MNYKIKSSILLQVIVCIMFLSKASAINPQRIYAAKPDAIGLNYKTYKVKVDNTINLNSWVCLQSDTNKPFIVISGSDAGNMANSLGQAKAFYDEGYNVILYDYRGFGESSDYDLNPNMLYYTEFAQDLKSMIGFIEAKYAPKSIILYGQSMGTIISRMNLNYSAEVKCMIVGSFVIDPKLIADRVSLAKNKTILLPSGSLQYTLSNAEKLGKPTLIFSGLKDQFTRTTDYKDFLSNNPNSRIITADCNHLQCFTSMGKEPNRYIVEVKKIIDKL